VVVLGQEPSILVVVVAVRAVFWQVLQRWGPVQQVSSLALEGQEVLDLAVTLTGVGEVEERRPRFWLLSKAVAAAVLSGLIATTVRLAVLAAAGQALRHLALVGREHQGKGTTGATVLAVLTALVPVVVVAVAAVSAVTHRRLLVATAEPVTRRLLPERQSRMRVVVVVGVKAREVLRLLAVVRARRRMAMGRRRQTAPGAVVVALVGFQATRRAATAAMVWSSSATSSPNLTGVRTRP
jgi:hypothetical protein